MPKLALTTSAIVAGFSFSLPTSASTNDNGLESANNIDNERNEINVSKNELGYNPNGGLLDSGLCCADCRQEQENDWLQL